MPGSSIIIDFFSLINLLKIVDFPTLGFPIKQTHFFISTSFYRLTFVLAFCLINFRLSLGWQQRLISLGTGFPLKFFCGLLDQLRLLQKIDGGASQDFSGVKKTLVGDGALSLSDHLPGMLWCSAGTSYGNDLRGGAYPTDIAHVGGSGNRFFRRMIGNNG